MAKESPDVSFVLYVLKTCGKNDAVVKTAATKPIISCRSITVYIFHLIRFLILFYKGKELRIYKNL